MKYTVQATVDGRLRAPVIDKPTRAERMEKFKRAYPDREVVFFSERRFSRNERDEPRWEMAAE